MKKEAIEIKLEKNGFDVHMTLKVAPEIEAYFREVATPTNPTDRGAVNTEPAIEVSSKWLDKNGKGLKFYVKNEVLSRKANRVQVMDNFGNGLIDGDRINVAFLRAVGTSEGITIQTHDLLSYEEMKSYIVQLASWTKTFYEEELRPSEIMAKIGFEV